MRNDNVKFDVGQIVVTIIHVQFIISQLMKRRKSEASIR